MFTVMYRCNWCSLKDISMTTKNNMMELKKICCFSSRQLSFWSLVLVLWQALAFHKRACMAMHVALAGYTSGACHCNLLKHYCRAPKNQLVALSCTKAACCVQPHNHHRVVFCICLCTELTRFYFRNIKWKVCCGFVKDFSETELL